MDGSHNPDGIRALLKSLRSYFPDKKIRFLAIYDLIQGAMEQHKVIANPTVDEILEAEAQAHAYISGKLS